MPIEQDFMITKLKSCIRILEAPGDKRYLLVGELSKTFPNYLHGKEFIDFACPIIGNTGRYQLEKEMSVALFISGQLSRKDRTSGLFNNQIPYDIACLLYLHRKKLGVVKKLTRMLLKTDEEYSFELVRDIIDSEHKAAKMRAKAAKKRANAANKPEADRLKRNLKLLGISKSTPFKEAAVIYKIKRKQAHPDTGGDHDKFIAVQNAWNHCKKLLPA